TPKLRCPPWSRSRRSSKSRNRDRASNREVEQIRSQRMAPVPRPPGPPAPDCGWSCGYEWRSSDFVCSFNERWRMLSMCCRVWNETSWKNRWDWHNSQQSTPLWSAHRFPWLGTAVAPGRIFSAPASLDLASTVTGIEQLQRFIETKFLHPLDCGPLRWWRFVDNSHDRRANLLVRAWLLFGLSMVRIEPDVDARPPGHRALALVVTSINVGTLNVASHRLRVVLRTHILQLLKFPFVCAHLCGRSKDRQAAINRAFNLDHRSAEFTG